MYRCTVNILSVVVWIYYSLTTIIPSFVLGFTLRIQIKNEVVRVVPIHQQIGHITYKSSRYIYYSCRRRRIHKYTLRTFTSKQDGNDDTNNNLSDDDSSSNNDWESLSSELLLEDEDDGLNDGEWLSDREKARIKLEQQQQQFKYTASSTATIDTLSSSPSKTSTTEYSPSLNRPSPYTDEEEAIISAMGGKSNKQQRRREPGFLGDSTLMEICTDYSVPISYLADVLCMWDVPVPINIHDRLGDLVTGEQAFALVEAVNTLDVSALHDRYSNMNIQQLCYEWDMNIQQAFEMCMKEGWSLPFGVQTCLRVEQERELLRVLGSQSGLVDVQDDDEYDSDE